MDIGVSQQVIARNNFGRFIAACEAAATETVKEAAEEGAALSRSLAPVGHKADPRTQTLRASISVEVLSRTSARWIATARHALPIETGAGAHPITGNVSFFWDREGRMWTPGNNIINHPGNAPQPYLRPAYAVIKAKMMNIARQNYPG